jgi:hypothetical protein
MARRGTPVVALLAAEIGAVVLLHRLARVDGLAGPGRDPLGWLRAASPEEVVAGGVRIVALAGAWWLLASTVLYLVARVSRIPVAVRAARIGVVPAIRRRVDRALVVSVFGATVVVSGPAFAGGPPPATAPPPVEVRDGRAIIDSPAPPPAPPASPAAVAAPSPPPAPSPASYTVAPGDNLWTIAAAQLDANAAEVASYWNRVVEVNRTTLRSGDPNLIYPGETIELPPPE